MRAQFESRVSEGQARATGGPGLQVAVVSWLWSAPGPSLGPTEASGQTLATGAGCCRRVALNPVGWVGPQLVTDMVLASAIKAQVYWFLPQYSQQGISLGCAAGYCRHASVSAIAVLAQGA